MDMDMNVYQNSTGVRQPILEISGFILKRCFAEIATLSCYLAPFLIFFSLKNQIEWTDIVIGQTLRLACFLFLKSHKRLTVL